MESYPLKLQPPPPPPPPPPSRRQIVFSHPCAPATSRPTDVAGFLVFQAYDFTPGNPVPGVYHQTALDACCIIANNEAGYLSTTRNKAGKVPLSVSVLTDSLYFYIVEGKSTPDTAYPVVKTFDAWTFPSKIPRHWSDAMPPPTRTFKQITKSSMDETFMACRVMDRDAACVMSGFTLGLSQYLLRSIATLTAAKCNV